MARVASDMYARLNISRNSGDHMKEMEKKMEMKIFLIGMAVWCLPPMALAQLVEEQNGSVNSTAVAPGQAAVTIQAHYEPRGGTWRMKTTRANDCTEGRWVPVRRFGAEYLPGPTSRQQGVSIMITGERGDKLCARYVEAIHLNDHHTSSGDLARSCWTSGRSWTPRACAPA